VPGVIKRGIAIIILSLSFMLLLFSCNKEVCVIQLSAVVYETKSGELIHAGYYKLSDDSLTFVKLRLPDDKEYTLPNVLSASGARYSDDGLYTWWTKGASAFLEKRDDGGNWVIVYPDCVAVERQ
jgi:membrane-bound inhibitor of C-type lysozyme